MLAMEDANTWKEMQVSLTYSYQSDWNVFLRESTGDGWDPTDVRQFKSLLICNGV